MTSNHPTTPLDEVLYQFSLAKPEPDAELIDEFVQRYPEYAAPITDLAVSIVLDAARGNDEEAESDAVPSVSQAVSLAMSRFQNRLYEVRRTKPAPQAMVSAKPVPVENPFSTLDRTAFRTLATRLHCNTVFLGMLRDREIDPITIPGGFTRRLGEEMSVPPELLAAHFAAEQTMPSRQSYRADESRASAGR